jgi:hypothetical protein
MWFNSGSGFQIVIVGVGDNSWFHHSRIPNAPGSALEPTYAPQSKSVVAVALTRGGRLVTDLLEKSRESAWCEANAKGDPLFFVSLCLYTKHGPLVILSSGHAPVIATRLGKDDLRVVPRKPLR